MFLWARCGVNPMKKLLVTAALAVTALTAVPASAATLFFIPGQNYAEKVHNAGQADDDVVTLLTQPSGYSVQYSADDTIHLNGNGFAQQDGPFSYLTIDPLGVNFSKIGLTVYADKNAKSNITFDVLVNFVGGGSQILNAILPSNGKIDVWADSLEVLDSIKIYNLMGQPKNGPVTSFDFEGVKHTSFDVAGGGGVIPEPGTWAMMILGFGFAGSALRMARRRNALAI